MGHSRSTRVAVRSLVCAGERWNAGLMARTHDGKRRSAGERSSLICVTLKLAPEDRDTLQREALRRRLAGEAARIDMSAIVRGLVAEWRANRTGGAR